MTSFDELKRRARSFIASESRAGFLTPCGVCNTCKKGLEKRSPQHTAERRVVAHAIELVPANVELITNLSHRLGAQDAVSVHNHGTAVKRIHQFISIGLHASVHTARSIVLTALVSQTSSWLKALAS